MFNWEFRILLDNSIHFCLPSYASYFFVKTELSFRSFSLPRYITITTHMFPISGPGHYNFTDRPHRMYFPAHWLGFQPCYLLGPMGKGRHDSVPFLSLTTKKPVGVSTSSLVPLHNPESQEEDAATLTKPSLAQFTSSQLPYSWMEGNTSYLQMLQVPVHTTAIKRVLQ